MLSRIIDHMQEFYNCANVRLQIVNNSKRRFSALNEFSKTKYYWNGHQEQTGEKKRPLLINCVRKEFNYFQTIPLAIILYDSDHIIYRGVILLSYAN